MRCGSLLQEYSAWFSRTIGWPSPRSASNRALKSVRACSPPITTRVSAIRKSSGRAGCVSTSRVCVGFTKPKWTEIRGGTECFAEQVSGARSMGLGKTTPVPRAHRTPGAARAGPRWWTPPGTTRASVGPPCSSACTTSTRSHAPAAGASVSSRSSRARSRSSDSDLAPSSRRATPDPLRRHATLPAHCRCTGPLGRSSSARRALGRRRLSPARRSRSGCRRCRGRRTAAARDPQR